MFHMEQLRALSSKEKFFCKEYLLDFNGSRSAIAAGYSKKTSREIAYELLTRLHIRKEIQRLMDKRSQKLEINAEFVLNTITDTIAACKRGNPVLNNFGQQVFHVDELGNKTPAFKPDPANVLKGCELLGKHLKLFTDKTELSTDKENPPELIIRLHKD